MKNHRCDLCHELPVEDHEVSDSPECALCHGGNGACDPNADSSLREHDAATDDCIVCHQDKHGFEAASECIACHFADDRLDDCGAI